MASDYGNSNPSQGYGDYLMTEEKFLKELLQYLPGRVRSIEAAEFNLAKVRLIIEQRLRGDNK
jgi:hypothetical protein